MRRALAGLLLLLVACVHADRAPDAPAAVEARAVSGFGPDPQDWEAIRLSVKPAPFAPSDPALSSVGDLRFRGGLEIASDAARFGGLSDLYVDGEGRLLAVTDQGDWFAAQIVLNDAGDLVGLVDGRISAMRGDDGRPLTDKTQADAEDLARTSDGHFAVSFERIHAVRIYDLDERGPSAPPDRSLGFAGTDELTANDSLEAMSVFGDYLLIGAEGVDRGRAPFWIAPLVSDGLPSPVGRSTTSQGYGLVALDRLPDIEGFGGDFLAMERFYAPLIGPRIVISRVARAGLRATPARWDRTVVADLNPPVALDNFEGLAITPGPAGVRVYIVSDDNFSRSQKTLIYAFDYVPQ